MDFRIVNNTFGDRRLSQSDNDIHIRKTEVPNIFLTFAMQSLEASIFLH